MDLRRCITHAAGAGAFLVVGLFLGGGGGALAEPGSGIPPGIYPIGPGTRTVGSSPAPTTDPGPIAPVPGPSTPAPAADAPPGQATTSSTAATEGPGTAAGTSPGSEVRGADAVLDESPAPPRRSQELGATGDGTRRLLLLAGVAMLVGAVLVSFTGRDGPPPATNRERVRQRLGLSAGTHSGTYSDPYFDDAP